MILLKDANLQQLVKEGDVIQFEDTVLAYQYEVADLWANLKMDELEKSLQMAEQKINQAKRSLESAKSSEKRFFTLGVLNGIIEVMKEIYREEKKTQTIVAACAAQTEKTDAILKALYTENGGQGMRHGELAEAVGTSPSNLSNLMKRVLESNAATSVRSGKNTYYMLTKVGRRYWENKSRAPQRFYPEDPLERMKGAIAELEEQKARPTLRDNALTIRTGDDMLVYSRIYFSRVVHMKVENIIATQSEKMALFDEVIYAKSNKHSRYHKQASIQSDNADRITSVAILA